MKYKEYKEKQIFKKLEQKLKSNELQIKIITYNLIESKINFNKFGWVNYASVIIGCKSQLVNRWMKKYMLDFYNKKCFKRKIAL